MSISMSPRENYLACLNHKPHQYTPGPGDSAMAGMFVTVERDVGGKDGFGVPWVGPASGGPGSGLPAPGIFLLDDVTKWQSVVNIPKPDDYPWEQWAEMEAGMGMINRDMQAVEIYHGCCIYERLAALMGFEEALYAMITEPDATYALLSALTDFRIDMLKHFVKYFNPDVYIFFDDVATERMLFMSPDTYRSLIKPFHTKMVTAAKELGVIPVQHTCGRADLLVQDMIDEGNEAWHAVQAQNDLEGIIQEHGDHFVLMGGYNTTGAPGQPYATEEMVRAEVRRCMDTYGKYGKGYMFFGMVLAPTDPDNPFDAGPMNAVINDEFAKCREEQLNK